ncbi:YidC/Oxa1 family membrane protein insertase [Veillonella sp. LMAG:90]|uniref:YidC/Oxa1 family membrane protein insertase n=1 Tax=Veillonella sp. LMAG:90 TaxID=1969174 RepID=UPI0025EE77B3|nr:YidC/Oxa1 family membrane protein insertase [Veillonella sp. LMAG:90]
MEIFQVLVDFMRTLLTYCYNLTEALGFPSYGIAIIIMTIGIKAILAPLTAKQVKSMKGMQKLQPKMKEIQNKYKNDPQRAQQEIAKMYKELGVNPLSGCLLLLVQMPFLIAIFYALQGYPYDPAYESFLWLPSLGEADHLYILPVLSALSTFVMSKQTAQDATGAGAGQQKIMQIFMPLFIGYISLNFPSGLVIYWVVSNIFQMIQQFFIYRNDNKEA